MKPLFFTFLKLLFIRYDNLQIEAYLKQELHSHHQLLSNEEFARIADGAKRSFGSVKLYYALAVGKELGGAVAAFFLVILMLLPSIGIFFLLLYMVTAYTDTAVRTTAGFGLAAVLAGYFVAEALRFLRTAQQIFPLWYIAIVVTIVAAALFLLQIPVAILLPLLLVFFLCFAHGGKKHE